MSTKITPITCACCRINPATDKDFRWSSSGVTSHLVCRNCMYLTNEDFELLRKSSRRDRLFILRSITEEAPSKYRIRKAA
jgi:hypothetical protein